MRDWIVEEVRYIDRKQMYEAVRVLAARENTIPVPAREGAMVQFKS